MNIIKFIILFIFFFSKFSIASEFPDKINIYFTSKNYFSVLHLINFDKSPMINEKFKKYMDIAITYKENEKKVVYKKGKARITGQYKDHLNQLNSSLKVTIEKNNINNYQTFRLLLPNTRNGSNEIFLSILLEEFGYLTPKKKIIDVTINDTISYKAIFQEEIDSLFLEKNNFRDSPIIKIDQRQTFHNRYFSRNEKYCLNSLDCAGTADPNIFFPAIKNSDFLKNEKSIEIFFDSISSDYINNTFNISNESITFYKKLINLYAPHSLNEHNLKILYDPIYNRYLPIYDDGDVKLREFCSNKQIEKNEIINELIAKRINNLEILEYAKLENKIITFKKKFEKRSKELLTYNHVCNLIYIYKLSNKYNLKKPLDERLIYPNKLYKNISDLSEQYKPLYDLNVESNFIEYIIFDKNKNLKRCNSNSECKIINVDKIKENLSGNAKPTKFKNYNIYPAIISFEKNYRNTKNNIRNKKMILNKSIDKINIKKNTNLYLKFNNHSKDLKINLEDPITSKLIIYDSYLDKNFKLIVNSSIKNIKLNNSDIRYNNQLLTGCVTVIDSIIEGSSFDIQNSKCEDSINFVRSNGKIENIYVNNSYQDGIDFDFSNLKIKDIKIENAGNDCLDFSKGNYEILNISVKSCKDKGVSIGEKSNVVIKKVKTNNSKFGLAVKDSSKLFVDDFKNINSEICIAAYRKKEHFNGGYIFINKKNHIDCKSYIDKFSFLKKTEEILNISGLEKI